MGRVCAYRGFAHNGGGGQMDNDGNINCMFCSSVTCNIARVFVLLFFTYLCIAMFYNKNLDI